MSTVVARSSLTLPRITPRREVQWILGVTAAALGLRLAFVFFVSLEPAWDGVIYSRGADDLAHGLGYTRRMLDPSNVPLPTAFYPVGWPAVLAAIRRLFEPAKAALVAQSLATAMLVPITWLFARRFFGRRASRTAALLAAVWPGGILLSGSWLAEPIFAAGVGLALLPLVLCRRRHRTRALVASALLLGTLAYVRVTSLAFVPFVAFGVARARLDEPAWRRYAHAAATATLVTLLAMLPLVPWTLRNVDALGAPVLVSTNGGVNWLIGTVGEGSFSSPPASIDCPSSMPEIARDRCRFHHALKRIRRDPIGWTARGVLKVVHTLGHESAPAQYFAAATTGDGRPTTTATLVALALSRAFWWIAAAFGLVGCLEVARSGSPLARAVLLGPIAGFTILHFLTIGGDRYHPAIVPMLFALAGHAMSNRGRADSRSAEFAKGRHALERPS